MSLNRTVVMDLWCLILESERIFFLIKKLATTICCAEIVAVLADMGKDWNVPDSSFSSPKSPNFHVYV